MSDFWEELFASLPPSPQWAPFWGSLFEGVLTASLIWLVGQIPPSRTSALNLIFWSFLHVVRFVYAIRFGIRDGWPLSSVTETLGRTINIFLFVVAIYIFYERDGGSWTGRKPEKAEEKRRKQDI